MSNSLPGASAATEKDGYGRDNFRGVSADDESYSYPNSQKQQISQPQHGYPPKDDCPQPYSSKQPQHSVQVLPPKTDYPPPTTQTSDQSKPLNGSHQSSNKSQQQQQQQRSPVRALSLPQKPPKSNYHSPSTQTWEQTQQQQQEQQQLPPIRAPLSQNPPKSSQTSEKYRQKEPSDGVPSEEYSTKGNQDPPSSSSNKTSHQSQPRQPPDGMPSETHPRSNQPQKQHPAPIEVSSRNQHPSKNNNQSQQQLPSADLPPSNETGLVPSFLNGDQSVSDIRSTAQPQWPTVQTDQPKLPSNQPVFAYPAPSNEPMVVYPDLGNLPPNTKITITIPPPTDQPISTMSPAKGPSPSKPPRCCDSIKQFITISCIYCCCRCCCCCR